nr:pupylate_cterm: ubiquitin-like protein Pup [uncultured bacterium]
MPQQFEQSQAQQSAAQEDETLASVQPDIQAEDQSDVLDAILNDIESTLETNAEEYVNSFVQKGGE